ncbi:hypothetical protein LUZ62_057465 [Rhynchospora pubera]|uniref:J domain-containing protein n=1 Tax=Rhynchospora pubera TaxID=906938 RepID=A0AAV8E486_9POAL|nr:hypothetical protein LUZ62_057465 [Rhynchospora pubera]
MECNRDDALRAQELSEKKLMANDLVGAKKFALKAQALFPSLEGISQLIANIDVHLAAETRVSGEKDLYAILGVSPSTDDDQLRKQYRRLALQFHPDKNKCVRAEETFQLVNEAFTVLSDRVKRLLYDQKRNNGAVRKQTVVSFGAGASGGSNGSYVHTKQAESKARARATQASARPAPRPTTRPQKQLSTFWTCCTSCKMQYEYLRIYLNHNLLCPNCKKPFLALETAHPGSSKVPFPANETTNTGSNNAPFPGTEAAHGGPSKVPPQAAETGHPGYSTYFSTSAASSTFKWGPFDRTAGVASARATAAEAAYAAGKVSQAYGFAKRSREESQAALKREREDVIRRRYENSASFKWSSSNAAESANMDAGLGGESHTQQPTSKRIRTDEREVGNGFVSSGSGRVLNQHPNRTLFRVSIHKLDSRGMLLEKGRSYVQRKQEEIKLLDIAKAKKKQKMVVKEEIPVEGGENTEGAAGTGEVMNGKSKKNDNIAVPDTSLQNPPDNLLTMDVPDPEFHDFDGDRVEKIFKPDQIWATYDDEDGMPRFYSFIQKVISVNPFKVRMAFLTYRTNSEFGDLNWISHGFAKTCGEFRLGRYETNNTVNVFSHQVKWEKGPKGVVIIFPQKGDIWALYRHWSPDWNENTPDETIYKYDMVEILEDYNEEKGITVAPLVKVHGFKAVFRLDPDPANVKRVPREEMFRFSHQVPLYRLTPDDAGAKGPELIGCLELDPAATPRELLQVTTPEATQEAAMINT